MNAHSGGSVNVYLGGTLQDSLGAGTRKSVTLSFSDGEELMVDETNTAVIRIYGITYTCGGASALTIVKITFADGLDDSKGKGPEKAWDGDTRTHFQGQSKGDWIADGVWTAAEFSCPASLQTIKYTPLNNYEARMNGGTFTCIDAYGNEETLHTIGIATTGETEVSVNSNMACLKLKWTGRDGSYGTVAE